MIEQESRVLLSRSNIEERSEAVESVTLEAGDLVTARVE